MFPWPEAVSTTLLQHSDKENTVPGITQHLPTDSLSLASPGKPGQLLLPEDQSSVIRGRRIVTPRSVKVVISGDVTRNLLHYPEEFL